MWYLSDQDYAQGLVLSWQCGSVLVASLFLGIKR